MQELCLKGEVEGSGAGPLLSLFFVEDTMNEKVKPCGWRWVTSDSLISPEPCLLWGVVLVGSAAGAADVTMRDGHNTGGDIIFTLSCVASDNVPLMFSQPIMCQKGLFCDVGSNVTGVLVLWDPLE